MSTFHLAVLNLVRRRVPTLIALISIAVGVASSGMLLRLYVFSGARFKSLASGGDAIVGAKASGTDILLGALNMEGPYPGYLPLTLFQTLRSAGPVKFSDGAVSQASYIDSVIPIVYFGKYKDYRIIGTDISFVERPKDRDPLHFASGGWAAGPEEIVLGSEVARRENLAIGNTLGGQAWVTDAENESPTFFSLKITGVLAKTGSAWDYGIYSNLEQAVSVLQKTDFRLRSIWRANVLNYFLVYLKPEGRSRLEALINQRTVAQVISIADETRRLEDLTGTGRRLGLAISLLILFLGGLSVAAMTVSRFDAMTLQLAVLRAMGFQKRAIAGWLIWEGVLLGLAACALGGTLDLLLFPLLKAALGSALPNLPFVSVSILESAPVWICAIAATVAAVTIPIIRLYGQDVHQSLRGT